MRYDDHLTADQFVALFLHTLPADETFAAVLHLWCCKDCQGALEQADPHRARQIYRAYFDQATPPPSPPPGDPREGFGRTALGWLRVAWDRVVEGDRLWAELQATAPERRWLRVRNTPRFQRLSMVLSILKTVRERWSEDADDAEAMATLALEIVFRLDPAEWGLDRLHDVAALACAYRGNCRRIRQAYPEAQQDFRRAQRGLDRGTGDPLDWAQVHSLQGSLMLELRRFAEAERCFETAAKMYRDVGDHEQAARVRIKLAVGLRVYGRPERAVRKLKRLLAGRSGASLSTDTRLRAMNSLAVSLVSADRPDEALAWLPQVKRLARQVAGPVDRKRVVWVEALICHRRGEPERAEALYRQVQAFFLGKKLHYDAALASLDLAGLLLEQGRTAAVKELAVAMAPIFAAHDIDREALAALLLFHEAVEKEQATTALVRATAQAVQQRAGRPPRRRS
jgi:tetratricopeptide (TPR) repeat protein